MHVKNIFFYIQVVKGQFDVSIDMGLHLDSGGLGQMSTFVYYTYIGFLEMKPKQRSSVVNILKSYDIYTWALLAFSLLVTTGTLFSLCNFKDQVRFLNKILFLHKFLTSAELQIAPLQNSKLSLLLWLR